MKNVKKSRFPAQESDEHVQDKEILKLRVPQLNNIKLRLRFNTTSVWFEG